MSAKSEKLDWTEVSGQEHSMVWLDYARRRGLHYILLGDATWEVDDDSNEPIFADCKGVKYINTDVLMQHREMEAWRERKTVNLCNKAIRTAPMVMKKWAQVVLRSIEHAKRDRVDG